MLEHVVADLLQKTLGAYLQGFDAEHLKLSVWSGDIRLREVELRTEALAALPVRVLRGTVGEVRVEVPWRALRSKPIVVHVQRVLLSCAPNDADEPWDEQAELKRARAERSSRLAVLEEVEAKKAVFAQMGERMGRSIVEGLLRRVVVKIADVHVRLECAPPPAAPLASGDRGEGAVEPARRTLSVGVTLRVLRLEADDDAAAAEARSARPRDPKAAHALFKLGMCEGFAVYMYPTGESVMGGGKDYEGKMLALVHGPADQDQGGNEGIGKVASVTGAAAGGKDTAGGHGGGVLAVGGSLSLPPDESVLGPLDLVLRVRYDKVAVSLAASGDASAPPVIDFSLDAPRVLSLSLSRTQYVSAIGLAELLARSERRHSLRPCRRPRDSPGKAPRAWWGYARRAVEADREAAPGLRLSWAKISERRARRLEYVERYLSVLRSGNRAGEDVTLTKLEDHFEVDEIVRFRALAKAKLAANPPPAPPKKRGWFGWGGGGHAAEPQGPELEEGELERLQEDLEAVAGDAPGADDGALPPSYAKIRARVTLRGVWVRLSGEQGADRPAPPLLLFQLEPLSLKHAMRPSAGENGGLSLAVRLGSLRAFDLSTPWRPMRAVARAEAGGGAAEGRAWVELGLETECAGGEAVSLRCHVGRLKLLLSRPLLATALSFFTLPPSEWAAAAQLESSVRPAIQAAALALQEQAATWWRGRKVLIHLEVSAPSAVLLEPPPDAPPPPPAARPSLSSPDADSDMLMRTGHAANSRGDFAAARRAFAAVVGKHGRPAALLSAANMALKLAGGAGAGGAGKGGASKGGAGKGDAGKGGAGKGGESASRWARIAIDEYVDALVRTDIDAEHRAKVETRLEEASALVSGDDEDALLLRSLRVDLGVLVISTDLSLLPADVRGGGGDFSETERALGLGIRLRGGSVWSAPPADVAAALLSAPDATALVGPVELSVRVSVRLKPAAASVPLLDAALALSPVRARISESELPPLIQLGMSLIEPFAGEPPAPDRCGHLLLTERRTFAGREVDSRLGPCFVELRRSELSYSKPNDSAPPYRVNLTGHELVQTGPADFELRTRYALSSGLALRWALHVKAASASECARWMSAIGAVQMPVARPSEPPPGPQHAARQASLRLRATAAELSLSLGLAGGAELVVACAGLEARLASRAYDADTAVALGSAFIRLRRPGAADLSLLYAEDAASEPSPSAKVASPTDAIQLSAGSMLSLHAKTVARGSPDFEAATAAARFDGAIRPMAISVGPAAVAAIIGASARVLPRVEAALTASISHTREPPPSPPAELARIANAEVALPAWGDDEAEEGEAEASELPPLCMQLACERLRLLLQEEDRPGVPPLCELQLDGQKAELLLRPTSYALRAQVQSLRVVSGAGSSEPQSVVAMLPAAVAADASLVLLEVKSLDAPAAAEAGLPRHEHAATLQLRPVRLLLPLGFVTALQAWVDANLAQTEAAEAAATAAEDAIAAASAAVSEAAAVAASAPHLPLRLSLHLSAPLVVLPAPPPPAGALGLTAVAATRVARQAARRGAVVIRAGDLYVSNAIVPGGGGGEALERLQVKFSRAAVFASADTRHLLDHDWMPKGDGGHWLLPRLAATAALDRVLMPVGSSDGVARLRFGLEVAPVILEVAHSEALFLASFAAAATAVFAPSPDEKPPPPTREPTPDQPSVVAEPSTELPAGSQPLDLRVTLQLEAASVSLLDDTRGIDTHGRVVGGAVLPLSEVRVSAVDGMLRATRGGSAPDEAAARLSLTLAARHFNPTNGVWEPILEDFSVQLVAQAHGAASGKAATTLLGMEAADELRINLTHAMAHSVADAASLLEQLSDPAVTVTAAADAADAAEALAGGGKPAELAFYPHAVVNATPMPLTVRQAANAGGNAAEATGEAAGGANGNGSAPAAAPQPSVVAPGGRISLHLAGAGTTEPHGYAETSHSPELVEAASRGDVATVRDLLARYANPNSVDSKGWTAAHAAARHGHAEALAALLAAGADVQATSSNDEQARPLHLATEASSISCVRLLLDSRADAAAARGDGRLATSLLRASDMEGELGGVLRAALAAAREGTDRFQSAELVQACALGHADLAATLLGARADPDSTDGVLSALQLACDKRHEGVARLLLVARASVDMRAPGKERSGVTALHMAARAGPQPMVAALLRAGADASAASEDGKLPHEMVSGWSTREAGAVRECLRKALSRRVLAEGWVNKLGTERKVWRRRYALLLPDQFRYYSDAELTSHKGSVSLEGLRHGPTSPSAYPSVPTPFSLDLPTADQTTLVLSFGSAAELNHWRSRIGALPQLARAAADAEASISSIGVARRRSPAEAEPQEAGVLVRLALGSFSEVSVDLSRLGVTSHVMRMRPQASKEAAPPPPLELVTVHDFWNSELRQLTFHPGEAWSLAGGEREEQKGLQFVALARAVRGSVPVYDWWSDKLKRISVHPEPAWEGEARRGIQFYAYAAPADGTVPVRAFWHEKLKQYTVHTGDAWVDDEGKPKLIFHAYPNVDAAPKGAALAAVPAAREAPLPGSGADSWRCAFCSYTNWRPQVPQCEMCGQLRTGGKPEAGADGVGVVCVVGVARGQRVLTVRSPVEVGSGLGVGVEMRGGPDTSTLELAAGEARSLPLPFTAAGSEAAVGALRLRPASDSSVGWGRLERLDLDGGAAIAVCDAGRGRAWMCCASLASAAPTEQPSSLSGSEGERRRAELASFHLPHGEVLVDAISCTARDASAGIASPGWLYLTHSYLCLSSSCAGREAVPLTKLLQVLKGSPGMVVAHCVELVLPGGRTLSLGFGSHRRRDEVLDKLTEARGRALHEATSGLARWRPLRLTLRPPLVLVSLLPTPLHVCIRHAKKDAEQMLGLGTTSAQAAPPNAVIAADAGAVETVVLHPAVPVHVHAMHALSPLHLSCWLPPRSDVPPLQFEKAELHGRLASLRRPALGHADWREMVLHPPGASSSSRAVQLQLSAATDACGSVTLSLVAPYVLVNRTHSHLALYSHHSSGAVAHAAPAESRPFSLAHGHTSARLGVVAPVLPRGRPSSEPPIFDVEDAQGLSSAFRVDALGNEACVELDDRRGGVAEMVLSISSASLPDPPAPGAAASSLVLTMRDRFELHNQTRVPLQWKQPTTPPADLPAGGSTPIGWRAPKAPRLLSVRLANGATQWCEPFAPDAAWEHLLKLRKPGSPDVYFRVSVVVDGSRSRLVLRHLDGTRHAKPRMPFSLVNQSTALLAVRQRGCSHWDLLGARETVGYAPDSTRLPAVIRIRATDASAVCVGDAERALERVGRTAEDKNDKEVQLEARGEGAPGAATPGEPLLLGAPCERKGQKGEACKGWLLLTPAAVSFMPFAPPADPDAGEAPASGAPAPLRPTPARSVSAHAGGVGELQLSFDKSPTVELTCVRDRDAVLARLQAACDAAAAIAEAAAVASKLPTRPKLQPDELVTVRDFWNPELRQLTFHPGEARQIAGGAREERKGPQFVALAEAAPGAVPVFEWWSSKLKRLSVHPEPGWEGEARRGIQFYAHAAPARGTMPIRAFWHAGLKQFTVHAGNAWTREETQRATLFHAYPSPTARARLARLTRAEGREAAASVVAAAARGLACRLRAHALRDGGGAASLAALVGRSGGHAAPLAGLMPRRTPTAELVEAVKAGERERVERLLRSGANADSADSSGTPALHAACAANRRSMMGVLLEAGADVQRLSGDKWGETALHVALGAGAVGAEGVAMLLAHGADPTARRADGQQPSALANHSTADGRRAHALLIDASAAWGADRSRKPARPALVDAVAAGRVSRVAALLRSRADPDSRDARGAGGAHLAAARGDAGTLEMLLSAGASANAPCTGGARPLHLAAARGSTECVRALLRYGAEADLADGRGWLPAEASARSGLRARALLLRTMVARADARPVLRPHLTRRGPVGVLTIGAGSDRSRQHPAARTDQPSHPPPVVSVAVQLAGLGVSLVDEEPREILYASLAGLKLVASASAAEQSGEMSIEHLQIDSCLEVTRHPVVLAPTAGLNAEAPEPTLRLIAKRQMGWEGMLVLDELALAVQPLGLALEQNLAARLFRLAAHLPRNSDPASVLAEASLGASGGAPKTDIAPPAEIFLRALALHPVSCELTLQMEPLCDDSTVQRFHPTHELVGLAQQLLSIRSATLNLNALLLDKAHFPSADALGAKVAAHYQAQALRGLYRLIGSLDLLGNPAALFSDIGGGVRTFFYKPSSGLVSSGAGGFAAGVAKGTAGLAGGVLGGTGATVFGAASGLTRLVGEATGGLAMDDDYAQRRKRAQQVRAEDAGQGLAMGVKALGVGFREGATGVLSKPLQGAMDDGARGFVKGLGRGLLGVAAKPISGVASLVSKTAEGIAADAKDLTARGRRAAALRTRVRQPRLIGPDGVLLPYPKPLLSNTEEDGGEDKEGGKEKGKE